jgi:PDDEXK-like domain of unknown function (DUF3799)
VIDASDPVRFSRLKAMAKSPMHYRAAVDKDTTALERGGALHAVVLGGAQVMAYPGPVRRGKEWDAFEAAHAGAIILTRTEYDKVMPMAEAVLACPLAAEVLKGRKEVELDWSFLGRECQSHVDLLSADWDWIAELKSCESADPVAFIWKAQRYHWPAQLAFYSEAVVQLGHRIPSAHLIVAVESAPPHPVTVLRLTDRALDQGRKAFRLWFERVLCCEAADEWPPYAQSVVDLDTPNDEPDLVFGDAEAA